MPPRKSRPEPNLLNPRYWATWLVIGITPLLARLSYPVQTFLGRNLGGLFRLLNPYRRTIVTANLRLCFPELDQEIRDKLTNKVFESLGISIMETIAGLWAPHRYFNNIGEINGLEHLAAASRAGNGVILLSGHFCSLDFAGRLLMHAHPACFTYQEFRNPVFNKVVKAQRAKNCRQLIHRHDTRGLIRALKSGSTVWYAPDQDQGLKHSVFAPLFGIPASTLTATTRLARLTGAAVMPFIIERLPDNRGYVLTIEPALDDFPGADSESDARRFNGLLEKQIRAHPEQYLWIHRRFKTRPEGEVKLYPPKPRRLKRLQRLERARKI